MSQTIMTELNGRPNVITRMFEVETVADIANLPTQTTDGTMSTGEIVPALGENCIAKALCYEDSNLYVLKSSGVWEPL